MKQPHSAPAFFITGTREPCTLSSQFTDSISVGICSRVPFVFLDILLSEMESVDIRLVTSPTLEGLHNCCESTEAHVLPWPCPKDVSPWTWGGLHAHLFQMRHENDRYHYVWVVMFAFVVLLGDLKQETWWTVLIMSCFVSVWPLMLLGQLTMRIRVLQTVEELNKASMSQRGWNILIDTDWWMLGR